MADAATGDRASRARKPSSPNGSLAKSWRWKQNRNNSTCNQLKGQGMSFARWSLGFELTGRMCDERMSSLSRIHVTGAAGLS